MTIKKITIENIKGIEANAFDLDALPNRPNVLVAPNGFGKSSIAVAFLSLLTNRLHLHEDHYHRGDANRNAKLIVEYQDDTGTVFPLEANSTGNAISTQFDWFVINNQVKAKGIGRPFGGRTNVSASLAIEPVVLIDTIPEKASFDYSYRNQQLLFGANGKILSNIRSLFDNLLFVETLSDHSSVLDNQTRPRIQTQIVHVKETINNQNGNAVYLRQWVAGNIINELDLIVPLRTIAELILKMDLGITSREQAYLSAIQIGELYALDRQKFKKACKYSNYKLERDGYKTVLKAFNSSWCDIAPQEQNGKLIITFPRAHHISNGQRDSLTFIALLNKARKKLRKDRSILIIDEVFDYLDDANLVAVQYYITEFIRTYREEGKKIYPLILTHLNPYYFKTFAFGKQRICFLDKHGIAPDPQMVKLLRYRDDLSIKDDVSRYLLHYHSTQINKRAEFRALGLKETWGELNNFDLFIKDEMEKYKNGQNNYDPLAICCAVRKTIEKTIYDQLTDPTHQQRFLVIHNTREKLEYASGLGVTVPEHYYLLGLIYNDGMHWKDNRDNISPIEAKLNNFTICNLIGQL